MANSRTKFAVNVMNIKGIMRVIGVMSVVAVPFDGLKCNRVTVTSYKVKIKQV